MVKCINCKHLFQGYMLRRKCYGEVIEDFQILENEVTAMFESKGLLNNDFECEEDHYSDGHPCIIRRDINIERDCKDFKPVKLEQTKNPNEKYHMSPEYKEEVAKIFRNRKF